MNYQKLVDELEWNDWEDGSLAVAKYGQLIVMASKIGFLIFEAETMKERAAYTGEQCGLSASKETAEFALLDLLKEEEQKTKATARRTNGTTSTYPACQMSSYERTKAQVYATGNKWQIENFHATHD